MTLPILTILNELRAEGAIPVSSQQEERRRAQPTVLLTESGCWTDTPYRPGKTPTPQKEEGDQMGTEKLAVRTEVWRDIDGDLHETEQEAISASRTSVSQKGLRKLIEGCCYTNMTTSDIYDMVLENSREICGYLTEILKKGN